MNRELPLGKILEEDSTINIDAIFKALADPLRRRILEVLHDPRYFCRNAEDVAQGICVQDIARYLALPQSTVSRHLAILSQAGLVFQAHHRTWHYYQVHGERLHEALQWLQDVMPPDEAAATTLLPQHFVGEGTRNPDDENGGSSK